MIVTSQSYYVDNLVSRELRKLWTRIPDWSRQENKPTYTADEVGAMPADAVISYNDLVDTPTGLSAFDNDVGYLVAADIEGKADKATTYTKTEVDNIIADVQAAQGSELLHYYTKTLIDSQQLAQDNIIAQKADASSLSSVATSGSYNDLLDLPTIPTVPTNVSDFTNDAGYLTNADLPTNHVTTDTVLNITGEKTFVGNKKLKFKQSASTDKLGFTAYNTSNVECGNFEVLPNDRAVNLGIYAPDLKPNKNWMVGFKYQAKDSGGTVHKFGLRVPPRFGTSTYTEYYIPTTINGLQADDTGLITLSANDVGAISEEIDPTVPDWAKTPNKPTYTESDIGIQSITFQEIDQITNN